MSNRSFGVMGLCLWLILYGLFGLTNFTFELQGFVMGILAIASGLLILAGK